VGIAEPDVALTDYALALECGMFVWCLRGAGAQGRRFAVFFAATACAAALGGTVHGFYPDAHFFVARLLWSATVLAIGVAALGAWAAGAALVLTPPRARWVVRAAALELIGYTVVVLCGATAFVVAIYQYFPAAVFLLIAFAIAWTRRRATPLLCGLAGAALTLIAATAQHAEWALSPRYFTYNATYHAVQAVACALLFAYAHSARTKIDPT
jgi:hypothetical protein